MLVMRRGMVPPRKGDMFHVDKNDMAMHARE